MTAVRYNKEVSAFQERIGLLGDTRLVISGTTALDLQLHNKWYRKPTDIDLIFYPPDGTPINRAFQNKIYSWIKEAAAAAGLETKAAYVGNLHPAERVGAERENFATHRLYLFKPGVEKSVAEVDYFIMGAKNPFIGHMELQHDGKAQDIIVESPQKTVAYKLFRHLTQPKQGVHDVYDITQTIRNHSIIDVSDPFQRELMQFNFMLAMACNGIDSSSLKMNRLYGEDPELKANYQESITHLRTITHMELPEVLKCVRERFVAPVFGAGREVKTPENLLAAKERHYLSELRKGKNSPQIIAGCYPLLSAQYDLEAILTQHPMILNMMGKGQRR